MSRTRSASASLGTGTPHHPDGIRMGACHRPDLAMIHTGVRMMITTGTPMVPTLPILRTTTHTQGITTLHHQGMRDIILRHLATGIHRHMVLLPDILRQALPTCKLGGQPLEVAVDSLVWISLMQAAIHRQATRLITRHRPTHLRPTRTRRVAIGQASSEATACALQTQPRLDGREPPSRRTANAVAEKRISLMYTMFQVAVRCFGDVSLHRALVCWILRMQGRDRERERTQEENGRALAVLPAQNAHRLGCVAFFRYVRAQKSEFFSRLSCFTDTLEGAAPQEAERARKRARTVDPCAVVARVIQTPSSCRARQAVAELDQPCGRLVLEITSSAALSGQQSREAKA